MSSNGSIAQKYAKKKRPLLVNRESVLLLHYKARSYIARVTQEMCMELNMDVLIYPPYSPAFAPSIIVSDHCYIFLKEEQFITSAEMFLCINSRESFSPVCKIDRIMLSIMKGNVIRITYIN